MATASPVPDEIRPELLNSAAAATSNLQDEDSDDDKPLASRYSLRAVAPAKANDAKGSEHSTKGDPAASPKPPAVKAKLTTPKTQPSSSKQAEAPSTSTKTPAKPSLKRPARTPPPGDSASKKPKAEPAKKRALEPKAAVGKSSAKKPKVEEENSEGSSEDEDDDGGEDDEDEEEEEEEDEKPLKKTQKTVVKSKSTTTASASGKRKVVETKVSKKTTTTEKSKGAPGSGGGQKWTTLEHNGVIFPPPYQPHGVKMLYDGKPVDLTPAQEEVATMYAVMKETDYIGKAKFKSNFWMDWKKLLGSNHIIKKLELCDFTPIYNWHLGEKEKKKQLTSAEKKQMREEKAKAEEQYTWALVDGVKEKVGNFRVEPPGLFRGRGEHPKMGKLKRRIFPENIVINIGKGAPVPECPMPGHKWKEIRHDNTVTWLAFWNDPINEKECKYVFLHPSSSLKAQSDMKKYEKARLLKDYIDSIRKTYTKDFTSSDAGKRQIAVATYLIDRLALRAGNEKDDDEADTVGCCSLKVEHVKLLPSKKIEFDFLGKDSIRYYNEVVVEEKVYKAIGDFKKGKKKGDDLFDRLDTNKLNAHLKEIMPELTAKVFRTYNASITLDSQLINTSGSNINENIADYQIANKQVAILCNHQRAVSKSHDSQMEKLEGKMAELKALRDEVAKDLERAQKGKPPLKDEDGKSRRNQGPEQLQKKLEQTDKKIQKMELDMKTKDDLKTVALGTSKINYLDPRITVAWCKRNEVPIEKVFTKSLLQKFAWAMDVEPTYRF